MIMKVVWPTDKSSFTPLDARNAGDCWGGVILMIGGSE